MFIVYKLNNLIIFEKKLIGLLMMNLVWLGWILSGDITIHYYKNKIIIINLPKISNNNYNLELLKLSINNNRRLGIEKLDLI